MNWGNGSKAMQQLLKDFEEFKQEEEEFAKKLLAGDGSGILEKILDCLERIAGPESVMAYRDEVDEMKRSMAEMKDKMMSMADKMAKNMPQ